MNCLLISWEINYNKKIKKDKYIVIVINEKNKIKMVFEFELAIN